MPPPSRGYGMLVVRILRGALKLRYLVLGGAIGGGVSLSKVSFANYITSISKDITFSLVLEIRGLEGGSARYEVAAGCSASGRAVEPVFAESHRGGQSGEDRD